MTRWRAVTTSHHVVIILSVWLRTKPKREACLPQSTNIVYTINCYYCHPWITRKVYSNLFHASSCKRWFNPCDVFVNCINTLEWNKVFFWNSVPSTCPTMCKKEARDLQCRDIIRLTVTVGVNPLTPTVTIWVQLQSIPWQAWLSRHL